MVKSSLLPAGIMRFRSYRYIETQSNHTLPINAHLGELDNSEYYDRQETI